MIRRVTSLSRRLLKLKIREFIPYPYSIPQCCLIEISASLGRLDHFSLSPYLLTTRPTPTLEARRSAILRLPNMDRSA